MLHETLSRLMPQTVGTWFVPSGLPTTTPMLNRSWFCDDYVAFPTYTSCWGTRTEVIGIGTVVIPIRASRRRDAHLVLKNVLHAPDAVCNIFALGATNLDMSTDTLPGGGTLSNDHGRVSRIVWPKGKGILQLDLSGPPPGTRFGPDPLRPDAIYLIQSRWPDEEKQRFEEFQGNGPVLSKAEKQWLRKNWGGEFKFLLAHGLHINKDEDREEGRHILRSIMADED